jgi:UV excision repair protein RAD23
VKAKIEKEKGWEPSSQRLIYSGTFIEPHEAIYYSWKYVILIELLLPGKILQDANTVASYNIEEKGFIVCMTQKVCILRQRFWLRKTKKTVQPKPAPAAQSSTAAPSTPAPATVQTPAVPPAPVPSTSSTQNAPVTPSPAPAANTESGRSLVDSNAMALGPEGAAAVANMESMGFLPADINRAMRAAFYNPDRAVEYLLNVCSSNTSSHLHG